MPRFISSSITAICLASAFGCSTLPQLPDADFAGITIRTVQDEQDTEKVRLALGLDFKVKNPMDIPLIVPAHSFDLLIDGAPASKTGVHEELVVAANDAAMSRYEFLLDLSDDGLGRAFGTAANFTFAASANVNIPDRILDVFGKQVLAQAAAAGTGGTTSPGGAPSSMETTLTFEHEGTIKLPRLPQIQSVANDAAAVSLVGETKLVAVEGMIGELDAVVRPIADFLSRYQAAVASQKVQVPVAEVLGWLGVPANLAGVAVTAVNASMQLQGRRSRMASAGSTIEIPVQLPPLSAVADQLEPGLGQKVDAFAADWSTARTNNLAQLSGVKIPTTLPGGVKIAMPFAISNPNTFAIHTPAFRLALVDGAGNPVARVQVEPRGASEAVANAPLLQTVEIAGSGSAPVSLTSELYWDKLGTDLLSMAGDGAGPDLSALTMVGQVSIDLGYGPITVPIKVPLSGR